MMIGMLAGSGQLPKQGRCAGLQIERFDWPGGAPTWGRSTRLLFLLLTESNKHQTGPLTEPIHEAPASIPRTVPIQTNLHSSS
jgi:hypothetical protein